MLPKTPFPNPFKPGAGQQPPYLAGRQKEQLEFLKMIGEFPVIRNIVITGLRGVGKTVLLEALKPTAISKGWFWCGSDLSETASLSEQNIAIRIITDLSAFVSAFPITQIEERTVGFNVVPKTVNINGSYEFLIEVYKHTPGLSADKLKAVLETVWQIVSPNAKGIVLAYDEAQILKDRSTDKEYPLSLLLEVIQFLQRKNIPYLLVLAGLPTLFPNLVECRTYAERMFHVLTLEKLENSEAEEAIIKPTQVKTCPVRFTEIAIFEIVKYSGGYPYFIQFLCKELFDLYIQQLSMGIGGQPAVTIPEIVRKLDTDFYAGRWARLTDRQRDFMKVISVLENAEIEFTPLDIVAKSKDLPASSFSSSHANQVLIKLAELGLVYKNRHGKYSLAVPMLSEFIKRQTALSNDFDDDLF